MGCSCVRALSFLVLILCSGLAGVLSQLHSDHGVTYESAIDCYNCSPYYTGYDFPACLYSMSKCAIGQKCSIMYAKDGTDPVIGCSQTCHSSAPHTSDCIHGGTVLQGQECYVCCRNTSCVVDVTSSLHGARLASQSLFCPGRCAPDDLNTCMVTGAQCALGQFCSIRLDIEHGLVRGECDSGIRYHECLNGLAFLPCPFKPGDPASYNSTRRPSCYWGCCQSNDCVADMFKHYPAYNYGKTTQGASPSTTTRTSTTTSSSSTASSISPTTPLTTTQSPSATSASTAAAQTTTPQLTSRYTTATLPGNTSHQGVTGLRLTTLPTNLSSVNNNTALMTILGNIKDSTTRSFETTTKTIETTTSSMTSTTRATTTATATTLFLVNGNGSTHGTSSNSNTTSTITTAATKASTSPSKTSGTVNITTAIRDLLLHNCSDQIESQVCAILSYEHDVCHEDISMAICADTCGICHALKQSPPCADQMINNGCSGLVQNADFCQDPYAVYMCPVSCDYCNDIVDKVINGVIRGEWTTFASQYSTTTPGRMSSTSGIKTSQSLSTSKSATSSTVNTAPLDCTSVYNLDCTSVRLLCASSFIQDSCPRRCAEC